MNETLLVFIAGCGLALVVVGLIAAVAIWIFRRSGVDLFDTLGAAGEIFGGDDDNEPVSARGESRRGASRKANLRAQAESLDFDAAVSRYTASSDSAPPGSAARHDEQSPIRRRRRSDRGRTDDEIFGGMLDEDGDGTIDF